MNTEVNEKDTLSLALEQALDEVPDYNREEDDSVQGEPPSTPESGNDQAEQAPPDNNVKQQHDTKPEPNQEQGEQPQPEESQVEEAMVPRSALIKTRKRAQSAEARAKQEAEEKAELQAKLADYKRQLDEAKEIGYEPREVPTEVTPELIQAMRDGDTDAFADYAEITEHQKRVTELPEQVTPEPSPQGPNALALQNTEEGRQVLNTLIEWRDDASDGIDNGAWAMAANVEAELLRDPQYSGVSTDVFYKQVVERTHHRIREAAQLMAQQQAESSENMPESLSIAGNGGGAESPDPMQQALSLEGAELVQYLNNLSPQEQRQLGMV